MLIFVLKGFSLKFAQHLIPVFDKNFNFSKSVSKHRLDSLLNERYVVSTFSSFFNEDDSTNVHHQKRFEEFIYSFNLNFIMKLNFNSDVLFNLLLKPSLKIGPIKFCYLSKVLSDSNT
jgi:hypothetical protein